MNGLLTQKMIKEMCGDYAYKRGEDLYRRKKVTFQESHSESFACHAKVSGNGDFHVTVENNNEGLHVKCTCPTLHSYEKSCHHIAAVLISILKTQQQGPGSMEDDIEKGVPFESRDLEMINGMLGLFSPKKVLHNSFHHSLDHRQLIHVEFVCELVSTNRRDSMFGLRIRMGENHIQDVQKLRDFLVHLKRREPYCLSEGFVFDPRIHRFDKDTDAIMEESIRIAQEEHLFFQTNSYQNDGYDDGMILVPPKAWESLFPLLLAAPSVKLEHLNTVYERIQQTLEALPLEFVFDETNEGFKMEVNGLDRLTALEAYGFVLFDGFFRETSAEECHRLSEIKRMFERNGKSHIQIPSAQLEPFMEKMLPGLRKLGNVRVTQSVSDMLTPLKAKLFLDRVHNRLLAGLEFHYGSMVINPVEERDKVRSIPALLRNGEKEKKILKMMEESGFIQTESGYFLQNEELEYHFLYHVIPGLQKLVQIYATTAVRARLFKAPSPPRIRIEKKERTDWLAFEFDIKGIPENEIRDLLFALEERRKYYRLRNGSLVSLESHEFKEMNRFLQGMGIQKEALNKEIQIPIAAGLRRLELLEDGKLVSLGPDFIKLVEDLRNPKRNRFKTPNNLQHILRDYQEQGFQWLKALANYGFGGILADDMGLGKTLQSIAFIQSVLPEIQKQKKPVLVVTPSSLVYNWWSELQKFTPEIQTMIIDGTQAERTKTLKKIEEVEVAITSYPLLRKDIHLYRVKDFHTVFLDEAQAFKNPFTQTAKAVKLLQADYRFALTGTPVENSANELWSIFDVVFPSLLPDQKTFHHLPRETVAKRIRPFVLRRLKEDVLKELPEKVESLHSSELLSEQKKIYAAYLAKLKHDALKHLNKETLHKNRIKILAGITRLRQICCHPALFVDGYKGSSGKFEQLIRIIEECRSSGKRMLIFSQFTNMLGIIGRELGEQGIPFFYLDGNTPAADRIELCRRFNEGEKEIFLISLKAGGTGLNLTGADTVILYDLWWNPAVERQAADRAYRMGQQNTVQVIKLVARGTIEEKINELQEKKKHLIEEIIQPAGEGFSHLTDGEIMEILLSE